MGKTQDLAIALNVVSNKTPVASSTAKHRERKATAAAKTSAAATQKSKRSREGKKSIGGFFYPEVSIQLKLMGLERSDTCTTQDLLGEAINLLFVKYGKKPIA